MPVRSSLMSFAAGIALLGLATFSGPAVLAQDATPEAVEAAVPRPVHIHTGNCANLGEVVQPLTDLTAAAGDNVGQARRAIAAESSFTVVPLAFDAIVSGDHAINAHLSAEEIGTYIACGAIGGALNADGSLIIGLEEMSNSGYAGIAFLAPAADGVSTNVSVFIAPIAGGGGRDRDRAAEATPASGDEASVTGEATTESQGAVETPEEGDMAGMDMGTPAAEAEGDDAMMMAGEQVPVSLAEFAISMPATLPAGPVTFAVTNDGTMTHSFEIEGQGLEEELEVELAPGETGMLTVDLAPGTYEVYCPVDGHRQQGMSLEVTVA